MPDAVIVIPGSAEAAETGLAAAATVGDADGDGLTSGALSAGWHAVKRTSKRRIESR
jgi:hypothetical protein